MARHIIEIDANNEVQELRTLIQHLTKRMEYYTECKEVRIKRMLENPTDRIIDKELTLIHEYEKQIDHIWAVIREAKFDIEDITGEPEA